MPDRLGEDIWVMFRCSMLKYFAPFSKLKSPVESMVNTYAHRD